MYNSYVIWNTVSADRNPTPYPPRELKAITWDSSIRVTDLVIDSDL